MSTGPHHIDMSQATPVHGNESGESPSIREHIMLAVGFFRRRYLIILTFVLLSLPVAGLYLAVTPPTFTATAMMMIDTHKTQLPSPAFSEASADAGWIESQIGILKSTNVASYVVDKLGLAGDPEFTKSEAGLLDRILAFGSAVWDRRHSPASNVQSAPSSAGTKGKQLAVAAYLAGLQVRRVGPSYLIRIEFTSHHPVQAAKIANAIVDAYAFEQLNAKYQANQRTSDWFRERLETLRQQTAAAERAVIEFRAKNNIVGTASKPMSDQKLADINSQLQAARAHTTEVQARLQRAEAVVRANQSGLAKNETISDTLSNPIITKLRTQYLELVNREADWSVRYGKNHSAVVNLRTQISEIRRSIADELDRILETYKSEYAIAKSRETELESQLSGLMTQAHGMSESEVTLRSLESAAHSYRKIYDDFLQRHTEAIQQESFPVTEARLISPASVSKHGPLASSVLMMAVLAGAVLGIGFGVLREMLDDVFRTAGQIRSILETECLAMIPLLRIRGRSPTMPPHHLLASNDHEPRHISGKPALLQRAINEPYSPFAEAIRLIRLTVDSNGEAGRAKVIGLTSCLPHEGKSTVALCFAELIAKSGKRVILIDFDRHRPALTRTLAPNATVGLFEVLLKDNSFADATWTDPGTGMAFLPMVPRPHSSVVTDIFASEQAEGVFELLRMKYDYVIADLPPLGPMADVRSTSRLIDSYVLVVGWGSTKIGIVKHGLSSSNARGVRENMIGAVLNKVDLDTIGRYDTVGKHYYHYAS
jgi:succinoglycan biosynthesis transport protein ExoP